MITDFHGCETEGSSFYRARICCVFGCIGKGIEHEDIQKDFLSFCSRSRREKKGRLIVSNIGMDDFEDSIEREF